MTYKGGVTNADEMSPVAMIGETGYATLALAIEMATSGDTIVMVKDTTVLDEINFYGKKITLDLNGRTITANFEAEDYSSVIEAQGNDAALTIEDNSKEATGKIVSNHYGVSARGGAYITVNSGTIEGGDCAALSGNNTTGNMNFIVNGGTLSANQGPAIYQSGQCELTLTGGTLNGGISLRMGQVNISGGTINATTGSIDSINEYYNKSGNIWLADALYVFGGTYSDGDTEHGNSLNLNITGGTFNCTNGQGSAVAIYDIGKVAQTANVTISGTAKLATNASSRSAYQVLSLSDIGVDSPANGYDNPQYTNKVKSSITGGYFTSDPTAYVKTGYTAVETTEPGYNYEVVKANALKADVAPAAPTVSIPNNFNNDQIAVAETVSNALKASTDTVTGGGLNAAANAVANNNSVSIDAATNALNQGNITVNTSDTVRIVVQTFMDIDITAVDTNTRTLTLDITPMYRTVATTAAEDAPIVLAGTTGETANAVLVGPSGQLSINNPVTIKLPLPADFAVKKEDSSGYNDVYVQHKGHEYIATITDTQDNTTTPATTKQIATFTNPDGFSSFTISKDPNAVATIGQNRYTTLQDAVDAVKDNETIKLTKACDENATVSKSVTFTLDVDGNNFTGTISAGSRYNLTKNGDTYTVTRQSSSSSGSTSTTYNVNVNAATNGAVAADKKTASKGTTVTVTASPSKGYVVDAVKVVDKDGKDVAVTEKDGKYVFTMPASAVTVTGSFKAETPAPVALPFTDVKSGNWFYDAVKYAYEQGLMTGTSATTFAPNGTMNRAMIVTVLYRLEKSPAVTGASKFTDVPAGQWYSDAVAWAAANKIVNGYDETTFGPMNAVTREQMAAILFRYEQVKGLENVTLEENLNRFPDQNKISAYAIPALQWAVGQKIINGNADGTLDPTGTATRAQVAQIFTNLLNK